MLVSKNKTKFTFATIILLAVGIVYLAFPSDASAMMGKCKEKHMEVKCMKKMMKCSGHMMMCKGMMEKEIVTTQDGGVIVMTCGKMYKYDKDLNLVKEVELKAVEDMKEKMKKMKEECMEKCQMMKCDKKK